MIKTFFLKKWNSYSEKRRSGMENWILSLFCPLFIWISFPNIDTLPADSDDQSDHNDEPNWNLGITYHWTIC